MRIHTGRGARSGASASAAIRAMRTAASDGNASSSTPNDLYEDSVVQAIARTFCALVRAPIVFTIRAERRAHGAGGTRLYPFGMGSAWATTFTVADRYLDETELRALAYIGARARVLTASAEIDELADSETLVLNDACNAAFDAALNRIELVEAVCRASLAVTSPNLYMPCVQIIIAGLLSAASAARAAGFGEEFIRVAHELRRASPPHPRPGPTPELVLRRQEYITLTGVRFFSPLASPRRH